jgi:glycosyl transferase family 25
MPTPVRAIGITHPDSPRHDSFVTMLAALGIPYELKPAVFVQGELPWSKHYDHAVRIRNLGYPMRAGEVGCFLAHRGVWEAAAKLEGCTLVLEDDAYVDPLKVAEICAAADHFAGESMAARLISQPRPPFRTWRTLCTGTVLGRPTRNGNLTVGYLITKEGARSLLRNSESFWCPVDDYMNLEYFHGCLMLHFEPEIAEHRDGGVSLIGKRTKPPVSFVTRVVREILRAWRNSRGSLHAKMTLLRLGLCLRRVRSPGEESSP